LCDIMVAVFATVVMMLFAVALEAGRPVNGIQ
jgi:hypothetical protein